MHASQRVREVEFSNSNECPEGSRINLCRWLDLWLTVWTVPAVSREFSLGICLWKSIEQFKHWRVLADSLVPPWKKAILTCQLRPGTKPAGLKIRGPDQYWMLKPLLGSGKTLKCQLIYHTISAECGYQILVTNICTGGRIRYISTDFTLNISALNSKHFTY